MMAKAFTVLWFLAALGHVVVLGMQWSELRFADFTLQQGQEGDARVERAATILTVFHVLQWIPFLYWILQAHRNVRARGAQGLSQPPLLAAGGFLLPFLNLYLPYVAMTELSQANRDPVAWKQQPAWRGLPFWWATHVTTLFLNSAAVYYSSAKDIPGVFVMVKLAFATGLAMLLTAILQFLLVREIGRGPGATG
jgi:hypothetical protein